MRPMNRNASLLLVFSLLAACGSPASWDKAGAGEALVQKDSEECRANARLAPLPERYLESPSGQMPSVPVLSREDRRAMVEADAFQKCMSAKGYSAKR